MKGSPKAALALLAADAAFANVLTTIDPCPSATGLAIAPITVTSQYQAVSTCQPTSACVKGKCSTAYPFTTYPYVSTVVPYAWNGTTTQSTTVTDVSQPFRVSEHHETLTQVTAAPTLDKRNWFGFGDLKKEAVESVTVYETVTRRAMAPFKECGRLAIPGWEGSGLCEQCESSGSQLLDVVECRFGTDASGDEYQSCSEWYETYYERVAPTTTVQAQCSSKGNVPSAGVYTWTFPQPAAPVTVTAPPTTVTVYIEEKPSVTVIPEEIQVVYGESWNAYVTKTFAAATIFDFEIYITQPVVYAPWPATLAAPTTATVAVPTGSSASKGSWPLPEQNEGGDAYYGATTVWADWIPASASGTGIVGPIGASTSGSGSSTSSNNIGPISATTSATTSSATSSNNGQPISASPSTSSSSSGSATSTSSSSTTTASTSSTTSSSSSTSSSTSSSSVTSTSSSSSSTTTTATTTTTTGGTAVTIGIGFYLEIAVTPVARAKRQDVAIQYLGFDANNKGVAVDGTASAALVFDGQGNALVSDGMYLGTPVDDTSLVQRTAVLPPGFHEWFFVGRIAQLQGTAGFCLGANGSVTAYVAPDVCNNPIFLTQQNTTTSSTTSSSATSTVSSTASSNGTTTATGASSSTATSSVTASTTSSVTASTTSSGSASVGPISASTSSVTASSTATTTGSGSSSVTTSSSTSASGSSTLSSSTSSTSGGLTISVGPISLTTSTSSSSSSGTATATTSSSSSSSTAICNINANICPDSNLITANTVATSDCAVGLTCTVDDLATLVPDLLTQNPKVATVLLGNNQVIGLSITPQDVQAAVANGTLSSACSALEQVTVIIDDPTCISGTGTTSTTSSSSTTAAATSTSGTSSTSSSSSMVTSTVSATTTTDGTSSTTSTTTSATASASLLCGVQLTLCAGQTLQNLGLNTVTCGTAGLLNGTLCDTTQVLEAATDACVLNCEAFGSVLTTSDGTGANLDPVIGTQSIQSIQALVDTPDCVPSSQTVTLSEPGCPVAVLKRRTLKHARGYEN